MAHRFPDASLNRIIRQAGASKGSFYHHFRDKLHLYEEVLLRARQITMEDWDSRSPDELDADTFWDGLRALTLASAEAFCRHPELMPLWRHFHEDHRSLRHADGLKAIVAAGQRTLAAYLDRGVQLGLIRTDLSTAQLVDLYEAVDHVIDTWFFDRIDADSTVEDALALQVDLIVDLLRRLTAA
ncbi:MAG: TetR/AcrR family transcriptional regulator [Deltaproteobacteria bacterium]|nr:MAG: TetR/AcrR family transcriptional regulator [Deltaproteobacteria bacterium]